MPHVYQRPADAEAALGSSFRRRSGVSLPGSWVSALDLTGIQGDKQGNFLRRRLALHQAPGGPKLNFEDAEHQSN